MDNDLIKKLAESNETIRKIVANYEAKIQVVRRNAEKQEACLREDLCEEITDFLKSGGMTAAANSKDSSHRKSDAIESVDDACEDGSETNTDDDSCDVVLQSPNN